MNRFAEERDYHWYDYLNDTRCVRCGKYLTDENRWDDKYCKECQEKINRDEVPLKDDCFL